MRIEKWFNLHIGEEDKEIVREDVLSNISFKGASLWILACAIFIASIGLNVNSTAVIIGAMLISPLMGPIVGAGFGLATYDIDLLKRALKNLFIATIVGFLVSALYFYISPFKDVQSELLARTSPTIYDVLIAFFGGIVGIGTLDPLTKLHVVGNSFTTQNIGLGSKLYFNNENLATPTVYIHKLNSSEPNIESYGALNIRNPSETTTTHNLRIFDRPNDTTPSFAINKSGVLLLGNGGTNSPDVRISRGGPNWVRFQNTMLTISRDVNDPISSPGLRFSRQDLHTINNPYANFEIMMSGKLRWGDASSIPDLSLERNPDGFLKLEGVKYDGATGVRYLTYDTTDKLIKMTSIPPTSPRGEIIDSESREMIDSLNTKITSLEDKIRDLELKIERLIDRQNP